MEEEAGNLQVALQLFQSILKMLPNSAPTYLRCADIYLKCAHFLFNICDRKEQGEGRGEKRGDKIRVTVGVALR